MIALEMSVRGVRPISATHSDESAAYDALFAAGRDRLVRICVGLIGADAAEDVVHDAYLRGRARFGQLRDADLFDAWVTRIAVNLCMNRYRSRRRHRDLVPLLGRRPVAEPRDVGLRELVERLPPRERTLVVLHYGHGYQFEEIARLTGLTAVNARTIVHRARRRLGADLRDDRR